MSQVLLIHGIVLVALAVGAGAVLRTAHRRRRTIWGEILDRALLLSFAMGWLILAGCYLITRRTLNPLEPTGLVGLIAPLALSTRRLPLRAILYYWGIALTARTILNPIQFTPLLDFCIYWLAHGAVILAVGYDLVANRYKPSLKACGWACVTAWVYTAFFPPPDSEPQPLFYAMLLLAGGFILLTIPWIIPRRSSPARVPQLNPDLEDSELIYST